MPTVLPIRKAALQKSSAGSDDDERSHSPQFRFQCLTIVILLSLLVALLSVPPAKQMVSDKRLILDACAHPVMDEIAVCD